MEWLSVGLNFASAFGSYQADKAASKAARAWQAYSNTMLRLSDAVNQNAITTNEIFSMQSFADQAIGIKQSNILTTAQAEVSAAAAGVKGVSVDDVMRDINRTAAVAENQRQNDFAASQLAFDQQRQSSAMSAASQQDYSYLPKPKLGSYLLNAAAKSFGGGGSNTPSSTGGGFRPNGEPINMSTGRDETPWRGRKPESFFNKAAGWFGIKLPF